MKFTAPSSLLPLLLTLCLPLAACSKAKTANPGDTALDPRPICGSSFLSTCYKGPPPLNEAQKKIVFETIAAQSTNEDALAAFLNGSSPQDSLVAELAKLLKDGGCVKEETTDEGGVRHVTKVTGDACPIASVGTSSSVTERTTTKESKTADLVIRGEDYAAKARLLSLGSESASSSTVTDLGGNRFRSEMTGGDTGRFISTSSWKMEFRNALSGQAVVELPGNDEIKLVSFLGGMVSDMKFPGFQALLQVILEMKEDGTGKLEATLNGEKIPLEPQLHARFHHKLSEDGLRAALRAVR